MKIEDVKRKKRKGLIISIRISKEESDFMKKKDISPGAVLRMALSELMK